MMLYAVRRGIDSRPPASAPCVSEASRVEELKKPGTYLDVLDMMVYSIESKQVGLFYKKGWSRGLRAAVLHQCCNLPFYKQMVLICFDIF